MRQHLLGKVYHPGSDIVKQGEVGDCMYVIQEGDVEVLVEKEGRETQIDVLHAGEMFGEMAIIRRQTRSATVRALGEVRVLTIDRRTFLRRVQEDPSLAFVVLRSMGDRVQKLDREIAGLKAALNRERSGQQERATQPDSTT